MLIVTAGDRVAAFASLKAKSVRLLPRGDESQHPREPAGGPEGGQFAGDGTASAPAFDLKLKPAQQALTSNAIIAERGAVKPGSVRKDALAKDLNARAGKILKEALGVDHVDIANATEESEDFVAGVIAQELKDGLHNGHSAVDWYDKTLKQAMGVAEKLYPEIATDPDQRFMYTVALAVTSQGEVVDSNVTLADQAFEHFRTHGEFPTDLEVKKPSLNVNLKKVNELIARAGGNIAEVRDFFNREMTVRELKAATGYGVNKMGVNDKVYGSAILGPKIGYGFYQNLNGNFKPITMDMWFMRAWGRVTNTGIGEPDLPPIFERFEKALKVEGLPVPKTEKAKVNLAEKIFTQHERDYVRHRDEYEDGRREKTELVKASERLVMSYDGTMVELPGGAKDRNWMIDVFHRAMGKLEAQGIKMSAASAQATWWTPEKYLWDKLGVRGRDVVTDYAKSLTKLAERKGIEIAKSLRLFLREFDPGQPRDDHGRWSDVGGGGVAGENAPPLKSQSIIVTDNDGIKTEVLINPATRDIEQLAREQGDDLGKYGDQPIMGAVRVMMDRSAHNLYAWPVAVVHDRIESGLDMDVGDENRDVWKLVGGQLQSDQTERVKYQSQLDNGIDPGTPEAEKERQHAARQQVKDWIAQGRRNHASAIRTDKHQGSTA